MSGSELGKLARALLYVKGSGYTEKCSTVHCINATVCYVLQ
jgi:hypothetical protein